MTVTILRGDCREVLSTLPDESVHCVVTSPPYWGLRDYGVAGQVGLEADFRDYIEVMKSIFREVRRVLRKDGTLWLNLGDTYGRDPGKGDRSQYLGLHNSDSGCHVASQFRSMAGLKSKDLVGIPWRVAFALQADGWYLRQDIIWSKPNPMPESVRDRCTKAHEYIFLLSKSEWYYYDADAVKEEPNGYRSSELARGFRGGSYVNNAPGPRQEIGNTYAPENFKRNKRSVWEVATHSFSGAHFAAFPPALIEPCILAGCPKGGTVLDPFGGAGTTGMVADRLQRNAILIELNPEYVAMTERRIRDDAGMFSEVRT